MQGTCGLSFIGDLSVASTLELAERADELGVESLWMSETYFERDAWTTLAGIALRTKRATLGTGVLPVFMRHPALLAMSFATLDELSNGRAIAGVGTGVGDVVSGQLGYDYSSPLTAMREAIQIIKCMLRGEELDLSGRVFSARNVTLECVRVDREIPIHMAAVGPRMCALAGELADGVHFGMPSTRLIPESIAAVKAGAVSTGRDPLGIDYAAWIICAVHEDAGVAKDVAREHVAVVLSTAIGESLLKRDGFDPEVAGRVRRALSSGGMREAVKDVGDDLVDAFAFAGTASQVISKVETLIDAGVTNPVLTAYGPYADRVLPVAARFSGARSS